jgi:A1 cistron-splicing factor AAR2
LQLQHCQVAEGGLFDLADESGSLLKKLLHKFKVGLKEVSGMGKSDVVDELDELENYLRGEHGWQIDSDFLRKGMLELEDGEKVEMEVPGYEEEDESGEYAPTVVDLTDEEMAALGITPGQKLVSGHSHRKDKYEEEIESEDDQDLEDMDMRY